MDNWQSNKSIEVESGIAPTSIEHISLEQLNDDVLFMIALELKGNLRSFSIISHRIRIICLPILFRECRIPNPAGKLTDFPQSTLWPLFRSITFKSLKAMSSSQQDISSSFASMSRLNAVRLRTEHGITWDALCAIMSAPNLRTLDICDSPWTNVELSNVHEITMRISITRLIYTVHAWRASPYEYLQVEATCIWRILERIRMTVESLTIPSETVQYDLMANSPWPRLQELSIYGPFPVSDENVLLPILLALPRLRSLSLKLKQFRHQSPLYICPSGTSCDVDFSHLRSFTMSYPRPDDQIFTHLPPELEHLSLRDSPRYYFSTDPYVNTYRFSARILTCTELLGILSAVRLPQLRSLEIVYEVDASDEKIISYITSTYPHLVSLEIHRYTEEDDVPVMAIATTLARLKNLHKLRLNLCFPETPDPRNPKINTFLFECMLREHALYISKALGHELQEIAFLQRKGGYNFWLTWYVSHDSCGNIRLVRDGNCRWGCEDEASPSVRWRA